MRPDAWVDGCTAAHRALEEALAGLDDDLARSPSGLPGWTVGHLVTHLARNADAHTWVVEQAGRGEVVEMYPAAGGSREAGIEAGAGRPAAELLDDLRSAQRRLEAAWSAATDQTWLSGLGRRRAGPETVARFVFLRWREVELHRRDLGPVLAPTDGAWDALPSTYCDLELADLGATLPTRLPSGVTLVLAPVGRPSRAYGTGDEVALVTAEPGRLVGWLTDRRAEPGWPSLSPWGY
jgi:maleylpyruvate isomerase